MQVHTGEESRDILTNLQLVLCFKGLGIAEYLAACRDCNHKAIIRH
jgi:hypothetical protein